MPPNAESSLEAGLIALKQGNYYAAISELEPIAHSHSQKDICLQAQVALVMAYAHTDEFLKAIAWGEELLKSDNGQVKSWAMRALKHLKLKIQKQNRQRSKSQAKSAKSPPDAERKNSPNPTTSPQKTDSSTFDHPSLIKSSLFSNPELLNVAPQTPNQSLGIYWQQAKRAKVWQPLQKQNPLPFEIPFQLPGLLLATSTFIALAWVLQAIISLCNFLCSYFVGLINQVLVKLPLFKPQLPLLYIDLGPFILVVLLVLMGLSPWLLDWLLAEFYGQKHLSKEVLSNHSREATRVIQRISQQQHWHPPQLRILPMNVPMIFTYGNLPRTAHIAVSQGLLEQLADDEVATLYAFCLGQIKRWDLAVMSLVLVLTLPIYMFYQQVSERGNKIKGRIGRGIAAFLASLAYGIWCLLTGAALLHARLRLDSCDRSSAEITGNPNGLMRALLKIAIGIAQDTAKQGQSSWQLESLNILAPISHQQSLSLGSIMGHVSWESFLAWERIHPYRHWLTVNQTHPLMGDRLERLCQIARQWHLETELHFTHQKLPQTQPQTFFLQIAPWLGIPLGYLLALLLWLGWQAAYAIHILNLKWIYVDWSYIPGFIFIGFSIGTLMRINYLFPDILPNIAQTENHLPDLFSDSSALPIKSSAVRIEGKLLGRAGISNCLAQDLILQSHTGLIKLHHIPGIGQPVNPQDWIGREIVVTGWFRRGATPWIDIQTLETQSGKTINSPHPILSTVLAVATLFWGAFIILTGRV